MSREPKIPLWMPIGVLALALLVVGWLRARGAQQPPLAPEQHATPVTPSPTPETLAISHTAVKPPATAPTETATTAPAQASEALSPHVILHGRLTDASGAPLPNVVLSLVDAAGHPASVNQSEGCYIAGGLAPGRWTAGLSGQRVSPRQESLDLAPEPTIVERDFIAEVRRLVPVALRTPEGAELIAALDALKPDANVKTRLSLIATHEEFPLPLKPSGLDRLPGNECGRFKVRDFSEPPLPEGCWGTFEFRAAPPLWMHVVLGHERVASMRIDEIPERLDIVVDPARIRDACGNVLLRAVDAQSGAPISDAHASYGTQQGGGQMTREDERLVLRDVSPGAYYVRLSAKGRCLVTREIVVGAGETLDLGDVPMTPTRPLKLHITDTEGKPQERMLTLYAMIPGDPRATRGLFQDSTRFMSHADGIANLSFIAPGKWVVLVQRMPGGKPDPREPALGARPWILDATCTDCPESTLVLEPTCELVLVPGAAAAMGLKLWIDTPDGLPAQRINISGAEPQRMRLAPGQYTLTVEDMDGIELSRQTFELGATPVELRIPR